MRFEGKATRTDDDCLRSIWVEWNWRKRAQISRLCIVLLPQFGVESCQSTCQRLRHRICRSRRRRWRLLDWSSLHSREGRGEDETQGAEQKVMAHHENVVDFPLSGQDRSGQILLGVQPTTRTHREACSKRFGEISGSCSTREKRCVSTRREESSDGVQANEPCASRRPIIRRRSSRY